MLLPTSALAFVPAVGVLMLAASTTLAASQTVHGEMSPARDASGPVSAPRKVETTGAGTPTRLRTYATESPKPPATTAP